MVHGQKKSSFILWGVRRAHFFNCGDVFRGVFLERNVLCLLIYVWFTAHHLYSVELISDLGALCRLSQGPFIRL